MGYCKNLLRLRYYILPLIFLLGCKSSLGNRDVSDVESAGDKAITLFSSNELIRIKISFLDHKEWVLATENAKEQFESGGTKKFSAKGRISIFDGTNITSSMNVEISPRGNSSLTDCGFNKLNVKFDKDATAGTIFEGLGNIKVNSHCDDPIKAKAEHSPMGRVLGDAGPYREVIAYRMFAQAGFNKRGFRPAEIEYTFENWNGGGKPHSEAHAALIIEDMDDVAKRLHGKRVEADAYSERVSDELSYDLDRGLREYGIDRKLALRLWFAEALVGNTDFALMVPNERMDGYYSGESPPTVLWNTDLITTSSGTILMPNDFDLASSVTGKSRRGRSGLNPIFLPAPEYLIDTEISLLLLNTDFTDDEIAGEKTFWLDREAEIRAIIQGASILHNDEEGRSLFLSHVDYFYSRIKAKRFYETMTGDENLPGRMELFIDRDLKNRCAFLKVNYAFSRLPVKEISRFPGKTSEIQVFDAFYLLDKSKYNKAIENGDDPFYAEEIPCAEKSLFWRPQN